MNETERRPRVVIVDDEAPARARLRTLLSDLATRWPHEIVGEAADGIAALGTIERERPDLVLLDVQMPGLSGIELARHLNKLDMPPAVVFVTAFDDYAVKAFEAHALDYLMKPIRAERLLEALVRAEHLHSSVRHADQLASASQDQRRNLAVQERGRLLLVPLADIVYLKAELKYVTIRTREREFLTEESLVLLEEEFSEVFIRVHRNALVARASVTGFARATGDADEGADGHWEVMLRDVTERLAVSRRQWPLVKALVR